MISITSYLVAIIVILGISGIATIILATKPRPSSPGITLEESLFILRSVIDDYKINVLNKRIEKERKNYELRSDKREQSIQAFNEVHDKIIKEAIRDVTSHLSDEVKIKLLNYFSNDGFIYHVECRLISDDL